MTPISFYLKRPDAKTPQVLFAQVRINGKRLKLYTDVKILPAHWSTKFQRVKSSVAEAGAINQVLEGIRHEIIETIADLKNRNQPLSCQSVADAYKRRDSVKKKGMQSFEDYFEEWIKESTNRCTKGTLQG